MPEQIPQDAREDFDAIVQLLIPFAEKMLREHGEFHPFAAMITTDGELAPLEPDVESEMPDANELLVRIRCGDGEEIAGGI